jgi:hypothetical protein
LRDVRVFYLLFDLKGVHFPLLISHWHKFRTRVAGLELGEPESLEDLVVIVCFSEALGHPHLKR